MEGTACLITGATSGIGLVAAEELARRGARVLLVARDPVRGARARERVGGDAELLMADLSSQRQVRRLAAEVGERCPRLDLLVNNAGLTVAGLELTEDGIERTFAVNHLAPFLLTHLLRPLLESSAPARVVTVASRAHQRYRLDLDALERRQWSTGYTAYGQSKLANILFTRELARRLRGTGVAATCLHPGVIRTGFGRQGPLLVRLFFLVAGRWLLTPEEGARTIVHLATTDAGLANGAYFSDGRRRQPAPWACDDRAAARLWQISERMTGTEP